MRKMASYRDALYQRVFRTVPIPDDVELEMLYDHDSPHLKALFELLDAISAACPPVVDVEGDVPLYHTHKKARQEEQHE